MEKTAMQELIERLEIKRDMWKADGKLSDRQIRGTYVIAIMVAKELLETERQQLMDCGNSCALMQHIHEDKINNMTNKEVMEYANKDSITFGEQYYNETFKQEKKL